MVKPYCWQFHNHLAMEKMVPLRHPMAKPYPRQGIYIVKTTSNDTTRSEPRNFVYSLSTNLRLCDL